MKITIPFLLSLLLWVNGNGQSLLKGLKSPVLIKGNDSTAYRDPAITLHEGMFYMFFTLVEIEKDGKVFSYTATSTSKDLKKWTSPIKITPRDQTLNYCSPGNVMRIGNEWILCLQTYPRPDHHIGQPVRYGDRSARIFIMRSKDLKEWGSPELLRVKGNNIPVEQMGRMIDPYLLEDKDEKGKYWCFYKQNGVSMSWSKDLVNWTYVGNASAGENVCVLIENGEYIMSHSPPNGIGLMKSHDLINWKPWGELITLGQDQWEWARGRITAGYITNLQHVKGIGRYLMVFHGSGPLTEPEGDFDRNASIGIAWSNDLSRWDWPGKIQKTNNNKHK
jgi:beta-xylosidase